MRKKTHKEFINDLREVHKDEFIPLTEYNGEQHYKHMRFRNGIKKFELTKKYFEMKKNYAIDHGYKFVEIRYDENWKECLKDLKIIG